MEFKHKEKAQNCAFSVVPSELKMLDDLTEHYDTSRSGVLQYLIRKEHARLCEEQAEEPTNGG